MMTVYLIVYLIVWFTYFTDSVHLKHPGSNYSAPVYVKRPESTIGGHSGKVLRMTGDLTGKHPRDSKKQMSEIGYAYAGSGYGGSTYKKPSSERGGTLKSELLPVSCKPSNAPLIILIQCPLWCL